MTNDYERLIADIPRWEPTAADARREEQAEFKRDAEDTALIAASLKGEFGPEVARAIEGRLRSMRGRTGCHTVPELQIRDLARARKFLRGSRRAVVRERLLEKGDLNLGDLREMQRAQHADTWIDVAEDWPR